MIRIAIDATPAAVQQAGVGRYARELIAELVRLDGEDEYLLASAGTTADNDRLLLALPPGRRRQVRRVPGSPRLATIAWQRLRLPLPVERVIGEFDLYHGTDFVLPPSRKPRVVTIHDLSFLRVPQFGEPSLVNYLRSTVPRAVGAADVVLTVSASVAAEVAEAYPFARGKIVAVPNGVRLADVPARRTSHERVELLTVGTVEPRKNLQTLIAAVPIVRQEYPDARLTIAGRIGWQADEIVADIRQAEARGDVRFVEGPDDARLDELYGEAAVAVFPSHYEGFGLPVLEAMARMVPVIANAIPSLMETGGNAAVYADSGNAESLAAAIVALVDDTARRNELAGWGRERAARYSWAETARRTRRAYALALER